MFNALNQIIEEWNINDKIKSIVTDNASNFINLGELFKNRYPETYHVNCCAHVLNLIIQRLEKDSNYDDFTGI